MTIVVTILSVLAFLAAFQLLGIVPKARAAIATSRQTAQVMGDASLDDDAKEAATQRAAKELLLGFGGLVVRIIGLLAATYVPIWGADVTGLLPQEDAIAFLVRLDVLVATTLIVIAGVWLVARMRR